MAKSNIKPKYIKSTKKSKTNAKVKNPKRKKFSRKSLKSEVIIENQYFSQPCRRSNQGTLNLNSFELSSMCFSENDTNINVSCSSLQNTIATVQNSELQFYDKLIKIWSTCTNHLLNTKKRKPFSSTDFENIRLINHGSFSVAHLSQMPDTKALCVLKTVRMPANKTSNNLKHCYESHVREYNALRIGDSLWLPRLFTSFTEMNNIFCYAQEYQPGYSLKHFIAKMHHPDPLHAAALALQFRQMDALKILPVDVLNTVNILNLRCTVFYIAEILYAVHFIHFKGILHRDLRPENIMITPKGHIKLIDTGLGDSLEFLTNMSNYSLMHCFDCARLCNYLPLNATTQPCFSSDFVRKYPPNVSPTSYPYQPEKLCYVKGLHNRCDYQAPEIINATTKTQYTPEADYWSVGIILYEMLLGISPVRPGVDVVDKFTMILNLKLFIWMHPAFLDYWFSEMPDIVPLIYALTEKDPETRVNDKLINGVWPVTEMPVFSQIDWDMLSSQRFLGPWSSDASETRTMLGPLKDQDTSDIDIVRHSCFFKPGCRSSQTTSGSRIPEHILLSRFLEAARKS